MRTSTIGLGWFSRLKGVFAFNRDLKLIFLASFLWDCGHGLYYPILPVYIRDLGGTILEVGLSYLLMNAIYFSTMIFGGLLADRFDRRKLALVYWTQTMPAPLVYSFATSWQHLIPGMIFYNFALFSPAIDVYIATAAPKERVARTFTIILAGYSLGSIFSPLLGAYLLTAIDVRWLLRVAFMFFLMSTVTIAFISPQIPEKKQKSPVLSDFIGAMRNKRLMSWILLFIPIALVTSMSITYVPTLLEDLYSLQKSTILLMGSIISAGQVVLAAFLGWFGDRYGIDRALITSFALIVAGVVLLGTPVFSLFLPLSLFLIGARQVAFSLSTSIVAKYSLINSKGTIFGFYMALRGIGEVCGPYVGGLLYGLSPTQPFLWASIFLIAFSFLVILWNRTISERSSTEMLKQTPMNIQ